MVHLVKLCVGIASLDELVAVMAGRAQPAHVTRMTPKRRGELLDGGSLYWVIAGWIAARQRLLDLAPVVGDDGIGRCRIVLDRQVVPTEWQPRRPFQGWRYLPRAEAPRDLAADAVALPAKLRAELAALGLL